MYGYYQNWDGGNGILGGIFMLIVWILLILFIVWLVRTIFYRTHDHYDHHPKEKENSALNILKERYARGEINKEEFEMKKKDLS